jgi:hypothetical protein
VEQPSEYYEERQKLNSFEELKGTTRVGLELYSTWKKRNTGFYCLMETIIRTGNFI